ncbi:MAG: sugar phosphate nucleotidyltransferase, partial [Rectinema sp.]|nr:sugar phosphate nucleotidyltransferase [Rectinema sp.]
PLGTAGGFLHALSASGATGSEVLVCNGDSLLLVDLALLFDALRDPSIDGALFAVRVRDAARYGTVRFDDQRSLIGFTEKRPGQGSINAGVYLFRRATIARFPDRRPLSFEYDVFPSLLADGARFAVVEVQAPFLDIGTEESLAQANDFVLNNASWFG